MTRTLFLSPPSFDGGAFGTNFQRGDNWKTNSGGCGNGDTSQRVEFLAKIAEAKKAE